MPYNPKGLGISDAEYQKKNEAPRRYDGDYFERRNTYRKHPVVESDDPSVRRKKKLMKLPPRRDEKPEWEEWDSPSRREAGDRLYKDFDQEMREDPRFEDRPWYSESYDDAEGQPDDRAPFNRKLYHEKYRRFFDRAQEYGLTEDQALEMLEDWQMDNFDD